MSSADGVQQGGCTALGRFRAAVRLSLKSDISDISDITLSDLRFYLSTAF